MHAKAFCRLLVILIGGASMAAMAQTNPIPQRLERLFELPRPHLRAEVALAHSPEIKPGPTRPEARHSDLFMLRNGGEGGFLPNQHFDIIEPFHPPADRVSRCLDAVFRPEEFHVGKTTVSCSILTAIKRKDPLCLLNINPFFLRVTW